MSKPRPETLNQFPEPLFTFSIPKTPEMEEQDRLYEQAETARQGVISYWILGDDIGEFRRLMREFLGLEEKVKQSLGPEFAAFYTSAFSEDWDEKAKLRWAETSSSEKGN